ncbi:chaperonin 10-like protein [Apodospora peruviana]|uniref:Chaperonin 10-like protein n=1 Tax=Apodospora peruviana TaxID=516989 RepID=A0AAE0LYY8_9PEZI|nr:chaperonin 10-like protein [Apodospora peruviana]
MATQTGITIAGPNAPYTVVDNIPRPTPGPKQALVKSLFVGINPVEPFMQHSGLLIEEFPAIIGSDVTAVVLETGPGCEKLKKGDYVFGCVPIGQNKLSPFQDTFLVVEDWVFKKTDKVSLEGGCTVGSGILTAGLALLDGQYMKLQPAGTSWAGAAINQQSWVIVMGGSGTVGQYAVQIAKLCGYQVLASTSVSKAEIARKAGADATFDNRAPMEEQLGIIERVTGGLFAHVIDASVQAFELSVKALDTISKEKFKYFSTTDDWSEMSVPETISLYRVQLGQLGRFTTDLAKHTNEKVAEMIALFEGHFEAGGLRPLESYQVLDGVGWEKVIEAIDDFEAGKFSQKPIVKVHEE